VTPDPVSPVVVDRGWLPTKKWWAAFAGSVASVLASWIITDEFDDVERGMCATALTALVAAYFKGNDVTPTGVPDAEVKRVYRDQGGYSVVELLVAAILLVVLVIVVLWLVARV
jgi:TctA family transporter